MTEIEIEINALYDRTREGDREAFSSWVGLCEMPLRKSLQKFARIVDVEAVLQEGLLRMWILAPKLELSGENASLRYANRLVHNLAISEARRFGRQTASLDDTDETPDDIAPDRKLEDAIRDAVHRCLDKLPQRPRAAIEARLRGHPDRESASSVAMKLNTFLQNIVRARKLLHDCLSVAGVMIEEYLR